MLKKYFLLLMVIIFSSCTEDRDIETPDVVLPAEYELIHYWNFNDNTSLDALTTPTQTIGGTSITYQGAYFDDVSEGTDLNAKLNSEPGGAIRFRNPAGDLLLAMPTLGYKDVILTFATMRTGSGAQQQTITYTTDGTNYVSTGLTENVIGVSEMFVINQFKFTGIAAITNNANFKIKISFSNGSENATGNNRIDNLSLEGIPTGDPDPDPDPTVYLLHYWNFNALPTGTLSNPVLADLSLLNATSAFIEYTGTGTGYADQFTPGSDLNARNSDVAGLGIRFRNPSDTKAVVVTAPTTGYKEVIVKFVTFRTGSGAQTQNYSYTLDGTNYITTGLAVTTFDAPLEPTFELVTLNFSSIAGVNNNPNFKIKINFSGSQASGTSGNNRFDNVTVEAKIN
jgi:hypothetical protein